MSEEQKVTNDIRVPNNDLEVLRKHFPQCFDKDGNFQLEKFKNNLTEKEINFSKESYSLEWLGKSYARILASDSASTLLKADEAHNNKPENENAENLLLKGDNLEVLKHLSNAYYQKIKMIYIDPPYNTGSDGFVYNDDRKFTVSELQNLIGVDAEKAKRILNFTQSNSNSHSAWLTFMYPRLYIAKQLLKDDGVIFVSIDDNEVAQLRLLMDEIFGEENFVAELIWRKKTGANDSKDVAVVTEYILLYSKNYSNTIEGGIWNRDEKSINKSRYKLADEFIETRGKYYLDTLDRGGLQYSDSMNYAIEAPDGGLIYPNGRSNFENDGWIWKWGKDKVKWGLENKFLEFIKSQKSEGSEFTIKYKVYQNVDNEGNLRDKFGRVFSNLITEPINQQGNIDFSNLFNGKSYFSNPKPLGLIFYLLGFVRNENSDLILDFFAGSGTTGDAIMQLNAEDGGNRKFILVQLPEEIDKKKNKAAYDFVSNELKEEPTIFEITKERLLRAAKKVNDSLDAKNSSLEAQITKLEAELQTEETIEEIKKLKEQIAKNETQKTNNTFKIFETTPIWEDYNFEAKELDDQFKLFDESKLTEEDIKALLTTWKTYDGIPLTQELEVVDLDAYTAYYGNGKLYLMHKGFTTENLKNILEKIDTDKSFDPKTVVAFGYHFESKNLRELSENLRNYKNKKGSDESISFITRY
jgi:adenine-specific DNA-methyltransferase